MKTWLFKLFAIFIYSCQFSPSWLHPNMGLLPEVIVPVFIEIAVFD